MGFTKISHQIIWWKIYRSFFYVNRFAIWYLWFATISIQRFLQKMRKNDKLVTWFFQSRNLAWGQKTYDFMTFENNLTTLIRALCILETYIGNIVVWKHHLHFATKMYIGNRGPPISREIFARHFSKWGLFWRQVFEEGNIGNITFVWKHTYIGNVANEDVIVVW